MSVDAISWAFKCPIEDPTCKFVLVAVSNYADEDDKAWPSLNRLAKDTGYDRSTIGRALKRLEEMKFLRRDQRKRDDGSRSSDMIHLIECGKIRGGGVERHPLGAGQQGMVAQGDGGGGGAPPLEPSLNLHLEPSPKSSGLAPVDDWPDDFFEQFWKKYPPGRKTSKKEAKLKLERIRKKGDHEGHPVKFEQIMTGLDRYIASRPDPQFTKAPEVWLNKECWAGEAPPRPCPGQGPGGGLSLFQIAAGDFEGGQK